MISVFQLESAEIKNPYEKKRPYYPNSIKMEGNTNFDKSYEVEKIINKRIKKYEKIIMTQYLIRWLGYGPEYNE